MLILNLILGPCMLLQTALFCSFSWQSDFIVGFPRWLCDKESTCQAGHRGSIPGSGRPLEKEMVPHSSILAWEIPWREEPSGLQTKALQESDMT